MINLNASTKTTEINLDNFKLGKIFLSLNQTVEFPPNPTQLSINQISSNQTQFFINQTFHNLNSQ